MQPAPAPVVLTGAQSRPMAAPTPLPPRKGSSLWLTAFLDLLLAMEVCALEPPPLGYTTGSRAVLPAATQYLRFIMALDTSSQLALSVTWKEHEQECEWERDAEQIGVTLSATVSTSGSVSGSMTLSESV